MTKSIPWREVFPDAHSGTYICGMRYRDVMTQKELAKQLDVSVKFLRAMEHGIIPIPEDIIQKLVKIFNTSEKVFCD